MFAISWSPSLGRGTTSDVFQAAGKADDNKERFTISVRIGRIQGKASLMTDTGNRSKSIVLVLLLQVADYSNSRTNHTIAWDYSKIITTKRRYHLKLSPHQRLCLQGRHINSALAPLNRDDGGLLLNIYLHLIKKKDVN